MNDGGVVRGLAMDGAETVIREDAYWIDGRGRLVLVVPDPDVAFPPGGDLTATALERLENTMFQGGRPMVPLERAAAFGLRDGARCATMTFARTGEGGRLDLVATGRSRLDGLVVVGSTSVPVDDPSLEGDVAATVRALRAFADHGRPRGEGDDRTLHVSALADLVSASLALAAVRGRIPVVFSRRLRGPTGSRIVLSSDRPGGGRRRVDRVRVTSVLRRFPDAVNASNVVAAFEGRTPRWTPDVVRDVARRHTALVRATRAAHGTAHDRRSARTLGSVREGAPLASLDDEDLASLLPRLLPSSVGAGVDVATDDVLDECARRLRRGDGATPARGGMALALLWGRRGRGRPIAVDSHLRRLGLAAGKANGSVGRYVVERDGDRARARTVVHGTPVEGPWVTTRSSDDLAHKARKALDGVVTHPDKPLDHVVAHARSDVVGAGVVASDGKPILDVLAAVLDVPPYEAVVRPTGEGTVGTVRFLGVEATRTAATADLAVTLAAADVAGVLGCVGDGRVALLSPPHLRALRKEGASVAFEDGAWRGVDDEGRPIVGRRKGVVERALLLRSMMARGAWSPPDGVARRLDRTGVGPRPL